MTDTAYIGMLKSETALAAVGISLPLLMIISSIEVIIASGAAVLAGKQLGMKDKDGANTTVTTIVGVSLMLGVFFGITGLVFMKSILRVFGASQTVLPLARDYAFWLFIMFFLSIPEQSLYAAARAESSAKKVAVAIAIGAVLNVILDPLFIFEWGLGLGVAGASLATTISQFIATGIIAWFFFSGRTIIKIRPRYFKLNPLLIKNVIIIGLPIAAIQITIALSVSLTNISAATLPNGDYIIAAIGVVQRLIMIAYYVIFGFAQGYQPIAAYSFGAKDKERFKEAGRFIFKAAIILAATEAIVFILLSKNFVLLFNQNPVIVEYGSRVLIANMALLPSLALMYLMTINFQISGATRYGFFLSVTRQGIFYIPLIIVLPKAFGLFGIYLSQPIADFLTLLICIVSYPFMKRTIDKNI